MGVVAIFFEIAATQPPFSRMPTFHHAFGNIDIYLFDQLQKGRFVRTRTVIDLGCSAFSWLSRIQNGLLCLAPTNQIRAGSTLLSCHLQDPSQAPNPPAVIWNFVTLGRGAGSTFEAK